jgi:hypothetical protein
MMTGAMPITHVIDHMKEGLKLNYLRDLIKDYNPGQDDVLRKDIYDVIEVYKTLFRNIEMVIHEELNRGSIDHREILDVLIGFSIAGEATDVLLERILEVIYPNLKEGKYTLHDLELIINHFPQELWVNSPNHKAKATEFNQTIADIILKEVDKFSNRELISFFQAFSNTPRIPRNLLNKMLNRFTNLAKNDSLLKKEFLDFLEIYAIMVKGDPEYLETVNSGLLLSVASEYISKRHKDGSISFDFHDLTELFWIYDACRMLENPAWDSIVAPLEILLNDLLAELVAKYKPLTDREIYEGGRQEMEFDEEDAEAIIHYYETYDHGALSNQRQVIKTLKSIWKKYDEKPEREKKWFVI